MRFASWGRVFGRSRAFLLEIAIMVDLLHHRIARVQIGAGVYGFGCEKQSSRDQADDGGKTPALFVRIVSGHENETGNGGKTDSAEGKRRITQGEAALSRPSAFDA